MNNNRDLPCMFSVLLLIFLIAATFHCPEQRSHILTLMPPAPPLFFFSFSSLFQFLLHLFSFFHPSQFPSFNPALSSAASFTDYNPVVFARSPVRTHTPKALCQSTSVQQGSGIRSGGRDGWTQMEKRKTERRGERTRRGAETTLGGLPHFAVHPERVQVVNNTWCSM